VGAAQEQQQWREVEKKLKNKNKVVIAQFAPSIRVSIGEEFGMGHGRIVTDQVVGALKELGFDHVFDVNFGADITTMIEAHELLDRLKTKESLPMITSCCPAWVKYAEFYYPQILPYLTTSRSPHIHLGGVIKTYWAQKMGIKPKDIEIVSVMPCTAKKFEAGRSELKIGGRNPVDNVITTREFAWLLKKNRIDFKKVKKAQADDPLGEYSGAAAIYGGSGGVMESALRTAHYLAGEGTGSRSGRKIDFKQVRGSENVREAAIGVGGKKLKVAVVNGIKGCSEVIEKMERYHYIEVMACPGGCIGGGGQPIPTTKEIREKRIAALYRLDKSKKVRQAHKNAGVEEVLKWLGRNGTLRDKVLYTNYKKRR
jgi:NADH-quinone oxidoreductase subunit G/NADP-reducing hydrogenase subunit HndD